MNTRNRICERNQFFQKNFSGYSNVLKEKNSVELRKKNRQTVAKLKRFHDSKMHDLITLIPEELLNVVPQLSLTSIPLSEKLDNIESLMFNLNDPLLLTQLINFLRQLVQAEDFAVYFISRDCLIQHLISLLSHPNPVIKYDIAWILTNVSSYNTAKLIKKENLEQFIETMKDGFTHDYVIQIVWLFGNLASDSLSMRDAILESEAYELIVMGINSKVVPLKDLYIMVWTLANFLRGHPQPSVIVMKKFISLSPLLISYDRDDVLTELLWGLSYITEDSFLINDVLNVVDLPFFYQKITKTKTFVYQILRIFGNIASGHNCHSDLLVDFGILEVLMNFLDSNDRKLIREALWALSNIAASTEANASKILKHKKIEKVLNLITSVDLEIKTEGLYILKNSFEMSNYAQIINFIYDHKNLIFSLCDLLSYRITYLVILTINIIEKIFDAEKEFCFMFGGQKIFYDNFNEIGGIGVVEKFQDHESQELYHTCSNFVKKFWEYE